MIMNALIPNILVFGLNRFEIQGRIKRFLIRRSIIKATQFEANEVWKGPYPYIPYKYSYVIGTIWLTALFAPFVPIVVVISIFGLMFNFHIEKYLFRFVYSIPTTLGSMLNEDSM